MEAEILVHGTCVAIGEQGVLLTGASGSGKSDLALRLIEIPPVSAGAIALVADDQVLLRRNGKQLFATAPETLRGKLEVRGLGILEVGVLSDVPLILIVELALDGDIERMPEHSVHHQEILGVDLPVLKLNPFESSAPAKVALATANLASLFSA